MPRRRHRQPPPSHTSATDAAVNGVADSDFSAVELDFFKRGDELHQAPVAELPDNDA